MKRLCILLGVASCAGAEEPVRVELPVAVDPSGMLPVQTDLGYDIELSEARLVIDDLQFTMAGEAHVVSVWRRVTDTLIPEAHAHPGHYQGGDVTGELLGHFVLDLLDAGNAPMGMATLIVGRYQAANFTFGQAGAADGLTDGDALLGHTASLVGQASRAGRNVGFSVVVDAPLGRQLVGAPFEVEVTSSSQFRVGLELMTRDPVEGDTLFDGVDFDALPRLKGAPDDRVAIQPSSTEPLLTEAYETLRRTLQTHDHFNVSAGAAE